MVATYKFVAKPATRRARRRKRTVSETIPKKTVSAGTSLMLPGPQRQANQVGGEVDISSHGGQHTPPTLVETKTATPESVTKSARALAQLPRRPRRIWSGWINDRVRSYRNMPVQLPGGHQLFVFGVLRGKLVYVREPDMCAGDPERVGVDWGVLPASAVKLPKNEHARLLGSLKRGVRERRSELKIASARANGRLPPRAGRRRGRPKLNGESTATRLPFGHSLPRGCQ